MQVPPVSPEGPPKVDQQKPLTPSLPPWKKAGQVIGYVWKSITQLPANLLHLILKISRAVRNAFISQPKEDSTNKQTIQAKIEAPASSASSVFNRKVAAKEIPAKKHEEEDLGISGLFDIEEGKADVAESAKAEKKEKTDPLKSMGAVAHDTGRLEKIRLLGPVDAKQQAAHLQEEMFEIIKDLVKPAQDLLNLAKPVSLEGYQVVTRQLNEEYALLKDYLPQLNEMPESKKMIKETITSIEEKMAEWGNEVLKPAETALSDVEGKIPAELQDFLLFTKQLEEAMESLKMFASRFQNTAPGIHVRVQGMLTALEAKKTALDKEMCAQVRQNFIPNPLIPGIGNCQFESIRDLLKNKEGQKHYRKLAVDYIRAHLEDFNEGIKDSMESNHSKESMVRYIKKLAGREFQNKPLNELVKFWYEHLEKKLDRAPEPADFYLDCMENHSFWGDSNTIIALAEALKLPILVFTRNNSTTWRFDLMAGHPKYSDQPPLILFYNGIDHYQDLIPKK